MREITYKEAVKEAMCEELRADDHVFFMGEDIGAYGGAFGVSKGMIEEFGPERILDTPISESGFVGAAVGAAMTGMRPIVEIMFSDFVAYAMDSIVNQAGKTRYMFGGQVSMPIVLRTPTGSGTGAAGQHSQSVEGWITNAPGVKVVVPSTPYDAKGLLKSAVRDNNMVVFLEQKLLYKTKGEVPEEEYFIPLGKADVKRSGKDLTVLTYGRMVPRCLSVAEKVNADLEVVDLRTLVPMDRETILASVRKTGKVLIVHEACQTGGFGGEIAAVIAESDAFFCLDAPIKRVCGLDVPIPYNPVLEANVVPTEERLIAAVQELCG